MDSDNFDIDRASEEEIEEYVSNLMQQKDELAAQGNYLEAESIKRKLNEIKTLLSKQKKSTLSSQQSSELQQLEENYLNEIFTFNQEWDQKLNFFNQSAKETEEEINTRHQQELEAFMKKEEEKLPKIVKFSAECLNIKKIEAELVKKERYEEAHFLKTKREKLEKAETEKFEKENSEKLRLKCETLTQKQNLERSALRQKLDTEFELMKKQKETELAKIILKYKNKRKDLELIQRNQLYQNEQKLSKAKNALSVTNISTNPANKSTIKFKYYPTEGSSPIKSPGSRKSYGTKYSTENKRSPNIPGKKNSIKGMQFYNTAEVQNEENQEEPEDVGLEENQEEARQTQAKTKNYEDTNTKFSNDVYQQYGNLPQENDNDLEIEQEQGREVVVENEES